MTRDPWMRGFDELSYTGVYQRQGDSMWKKLLGSILRHGATALGGAAVVGGDETQAIIGAIVGVVGAISSLVKSIKDAKKSAAEAERITR